MDLNKTKTDQKAEREGVWMSYDDDARFKIARIKNPDALAAYQHKTRFLRGRISESKQEEIMTDIVADHVLLDWENISIGGEALSYTRENALRVLIEFPAVRDFVLRESQNVENFLAEKTAEAAEAIKKK